MTLLAMVATAAPASSQTLVVRGSDTLTGLSQRWAEAYKAKHPGAAFEVSGGGPTEAFTALAGKKADVVLISRAIRFKEAGAFEAACGQRPTEFKAAVNGLAVYVNTNNPVETLTYEELAAVFNGKYRNWKEVGGPDRAISLYGLDTDTPQGELFNEEVLNGKGIPADVHFMAASALLKAIADDPKAIGFGPFARLEGVRTPNIKRAFSSTPVEPTAENLGNRIYPITRFVFCYLHPTAASSEAKAYADWLRSDEGQKVATEAGYFPLAAKWRPKS